MLVGTYLLYRGLTIICRISIVYTIYNIKELRIFSFPYKRLSPKKSSTCIYFNLFGSFKAKYIDRPASVGTSITPAVPVVLDYGFTRRWGVEIEAYNCTREKLIRELWEADINISFEGYSPILLQIIGNWFLTVA